MPSQVRVHWDGDAATGSRSEPLHAAGLVRRPRAVSTPAAAVYDCRSGTATAPRPPSTTRITSRRSSPSTICYLFGEGNHYSHLLQARRAPGARGRPGGHALCGLGAECRARQRRRLVQPTGTVASTRCRRAAASGIWELFIPDVGPGAAYKYEIRTRGGHTLLKSDPYGFAMQLRPGNCSIVADARRLRMARCRVAAGRAQDATRTQQPINIYEVHPGAGVVHYDRDAAVPELARARRRTDPVRARSRLHAHRTDGRGRTSVRRLPGVTRSSGYYAPSCALRHAARFHALRRPLSPGRHRRDHRLGARALPAR